MLIREIKQFKEIDKLQQLEDSPGKDYSIQTLWDEYDNFKKIGTNINTGLKVNKLTYSNFEGNIRKHYQEYFQNKDFLYSINNRIRLTKWGMNTTQSIMVPAMLSMVTGVFAILGTYTKEVSINSFNDIVLNIELLIFFIINGVIVVDSITHNKRDSDKLYFYNTILHIIQDSQNNNNLDKN